MREDEIKLYLALKEKYEKENKPKNEFKGEVTLTSEKKEDFDWQGYMVDPNTNEIFMDYKNLPEGKHKKLRWDKK